MGAPARSRRGPTRTRGASAPGTPAPAEPEAPLTSPTPPLLTAPLEALVHRAPVGIWLVDPGFRIAFINGVAQPLFHGIADAVGRDFEEVAHLLWDDEHAGKMVLRLRHTLETGESCGAAEPAPLRVDQGKVKYYEWRIDRIPFSGEKHGLVGYLRDVTEQKASEEARADLVAESEQHRRLYETIISSTPDLVYVFDLDYCFTFVNDALLEMWGRSLEESIGKRLLEVGYEPWHAEMHEREIDEVVATKRAVRGEVGFPHATLGRRVYDYILVPVFDEAGEVESVAGTTRDVTDRQNHQIERERLLREVEAEQAQLAELFEHAPSFMATLSGPDHVFERANTNYYQLVGNRDILGKPVREAIPEAERQGFVDLLDRVYETGEAYHGSDTRIDLKDPIGRGTEQRWLDFVYQPIRDANGTISGIVIQGVDLTERKRAEMAVRESEERFRNLADHIAQLAWMADGEGSIYWFNRRWFDYTGTTLKEMKGWGWTAVHHPEYVRPVVDKFAACVQEGRNWEDTFPLRSKEGEYRWFLSRAVPIRDESGKVIRWFGTNTDIDEQVALENALKDADRRKDEFLATLAHELRNPLGPIRMAADLLNVVKDEPARLEEVAEILSRQTANMTRLIDDLLDVSRITRGKVDLRTEQFDLAALIAQNAEAFRAECMREGVQFSLNLPERPLVIDGDPVRLAQVVHNLLNNAYKFTDSGGSIRLVCAEEDGDALIRVQDTGVGIAPEDLGRIFEMFWQIGSPGRTTRGGLGIGLSLTESLVELHGGTVTAKSEGRGKGSEFTVRLPLAQRVEADTSGGAAPPTERDRPHTRPCGRTVSRRVLAVDDNSDTLEAIATLLLAKGHRVETADNGLEAIDKARTHEPDVVLLDIGLPDIDGYEIARRIRRESWGRNLFLVAMTGWGQEKDKQDALSAGFDVHLTKPADSAVIDQILFDLRG